MELNDVITQLDMRMLAKLARGVMAAPVMDDDEIVRVQRLVTMNLARDFAAFHGTRTPVRLRIWGITDAGKAVLEQSRMNPKGSQLTLDQSDPRMQEPIDFPAKPVKPAQKVEESSKVARGSIELK